MSRNYTNQFIKLVDNVLSKETSIFSDLKEEKERIKSYPHLQKRILELYNIKYETNRNNAKEVFTEHIKTFILENEESFSMNINILYNVSKQLHIDYLLNDGKDEKYIIYYSLATTLNYYGIFREEKIVDLSNTSFWQELIKKCYLLYLFNPNGFRSDLNEDYMTEITHFVNSLKYFKNKTNITIDCIDNEVIFRKRQEYKIILLIEKKLSQVDIFEFIDFILIQNRSHKAIPFNYIINIALKNINNSSFKKKDEKTFKSIIELCSNFLNLYKLRSFNMWEYMMINEKNIEDILKKQILHSSLYSLNYILKGSTVINYIDNLLGNEILNNEFENKFNFTKKELITFLHDADKLSNNSNIIKIDIKISNDIIDIINFFSIDCKVINLNYSNPIDSSKTKNLFIHNPIIKYKDTYYLIGYKYFKMNFYNALIEKIRLNIDKNINAKIGNKIDNYVENIFKKNNFDVYSGKYEITKNEGYECDLVIKLDDKIVFIENKNKALTKNSYNGSSVHILQDLTRAFATSQLQLLRHEKNILEKQQLNFTDGKVLNYNNERIIKISLSANNWYSVMNNIPRNMVHALIRRRFTFRGNVLQKDKDDFEKTNKDLDKLSKLLVELEKQYDINDLLFSSLFIPLELISDNDNDKNAINYIIGLIHSKNDVIDIHDAYNYYKQMMESK